MSSSLGLLVSALNKTISPAGASPVAIAPNLGPLLFFFLDNLSTRWNVSFFAAVQGLNRETFRYALVSPIGGTPVDSVGGIISAVDSPAPVLRFCGYSSRKDRRCSFFPFCCSALDELMPAKTVAHDSVDCAIAREVTESSSRERSMSMNSDSSFFLDALRRVWEEDEPVSITPYLTSLGYGSYYLVGYSTSAFSSPPANQQEAAVLGIEVDAIEGVV